MNAAERNARRDELATKLWGRYQSPSQVYSEAPASTQAIIDKMIDAEVTE